MRHKELEPQLTEVAIVLKQKMHQIVHFSPLLFFMAGDEGFEPPNAWTKTMCLTTWPIPNTLLYYHPSEGSNY